MVKTDYEFERIWWNAKAKKEEIDMFDEKINRELRWKEINKQLSADINTILDVGGGTGVFSIPLAERGFKVVHFDLSEEMIAIAKKKSEEKMIKNITFEQGISADLSRFNDDSFDLVLNMDGPVSFCGIDAEKAIKETIRVAKKKVIMTVSNRANMIVSILKSGIRFSDERFIPAIYEMFDTGFWHTQQYGENKQLVKGCTNDYLGPIKAFLPQEIKLIFEKSGMKIERLTSIGSLTNHCGKEFLGQLLEKPKLYHEFIELCDRFDKEICPYSIGSNQRAGLIIVASK
ncbi:MAG TPA: class I SAM-dependent methyltransferase [Firmicutes bacterium]|jgi:ubiquinone/menaquinone biosynthesis C-methylase UbiE|nr:class I SAM-dependent methyltransferase [Bacillota bacterium]